MNKIIKEILKHIPEGKVSDAVFEGANIVLYTKDTEFFLKNDGLIKDIVQDIKKRVELRVDPELTEEEDKAEEHIRKILPEKCGVTQILFDSQRSQVVIEADKPGLAIGKQGALLREIREKTFWVPLIRRAPPIRSKIVENIRGVLYRDSDYRRKFLHKIGQRIYDGWQREKKEEWIRVSMLGAGRQVGRSSIYLQTPESRILMDCGVDVAGGKNGMFPFLDAPEFDINKLDAVIISHAHLDHVGFTPYLFKFGYRGPVYLTPPSRDIAGLMLLDYVKIMHSESGEGIFGADDVKEMIRHTIAVDYEEVTDITPDVRMTLYNAGHVLGSAMIHLNVGNGLHNLMYTGDMKYGQTALLAPAATKFPRLESVIVESTYGGKDNVLPPKQESDEYLAEIISSTIKRGGKVLLPVLGVGRAQEVLMIIEQLIRTGKLDRIPVYIDGMVWDVTAIHTAYPEYLNAGIRRQIFHKDENPFLSDVFKQVGSAKERMQVIEDTGPCVILATSGMLVGGPSVEYLKHLGGSSKNSLCFVAYQGQGSLGRRIQQGEREVHFATGSKQEYLKLNCQVYTIEGFSGHSGRKQLMNFFQKCQPKPKKVIVVHGESSRCLDLASSLHKQFRIETNAPKNLEVIRIK